jgi:hypothetical protein
VHDSTVAIGVVLARDGGSHQGVVVTNASLGAIDVKDLGETAGDAPPPKPFFVGDKLMVAFYAREKTRTLRVRAVADDGAAPSDFAQGGDESFAFDVVPLPTGGVAAAWDEDEGSRGVVKVARAGKPPIVVTDDATDSDSPEIVALSGDRVLVAWVSRKNEQIEGGADNAIERPGEDKSFRWASAAVVDLSARADDARKSDGGARSGITTARVTHETGHVAGFALARARGEAHLFIQDEGEGTEGAGGRIQDFILVKAGAADLAKPFEGHAQLPSGVGHALVDYLPSGDDAGWLSFTDVAEHQMLAWVDREPTVRATTEPTMDSGRPLAVVGDKLISLRVPEERAGAVTAAELVALTCAP